MVNNIKYNQHILHERERGRERETGCAVDTDHFEYGSRYHCREIVGGGEPWSDGGMNKVG